MYEGLLVSAHQISEGAGAGKHKLLAGIVLLMGLYPVGSWSMFLGSLQVPGCLPGHQVATQADLL